MLVAGRENCTAHQWSLTTLLSKRRKKLHKLFCFAGQDSINKGTTNKLTPQKTIDPIYKAGSVPRKEKYYMS
jgi:hypothetical protein